MEERMLIVERQIGQLQDSMGKLTDQLVGDGSDLAPGVVGILANHSQELRDVKTRIGRVEQMVDRLRWTLAGASSVGGLVGGGLVFIIREIILGGGPG